MLIYMTTPLPFCLVGVIIGEMENRGEKNGKKIVFLVVWLRGKNERKVVVLSIFHPDPQKCNIYNEERKHD